MKDLDWDLEFNDIARIHNCSDKVMRGKPSSRAIRDRRDIEKAFAAVKAAKGESTPAISKKEFRKKAYSFAIPGVWPILVQIFLSALIKMVIEYLISRMYASEGESTVYGDIQLPPE